MFDSSIRSLEEALIQLQYALGDYYSCGASDPATLDAPLGELRKIVTSTQLAITQARSADKFYATDIKSQKNNPG
jgi:hypothetical protein